MWCSVGRLALPPVQLVTRAGTAQTTMLSSLFWVLALAAVVTAAASLAGISNAAIQHLPSGQSRAAAFLAPLAGLMVWCALGASVSLRDYHRSVTVQYHGITATGVVTGLVPVSHLQRYVAFVFLAALAVASARSMVKKRPAPGDLGLQES